MRWPVVGVGWMSLSKYETLTSKKVLMKYDVTPTSTNEQAITINQLFQKYKLYLACRPTTETLICSLIRKLNLYLTLKVA